VAKFHTARRARRDDEPLVVRRGRAVLKRVARTAVPAPVDERRVLVVVGCQRSGTTMLQQSLLDRSWRVVILEEHDRRLVRTDDPDRILWKPLQEISPRMIQLPFELVVVKPLVESHRTIEILDSISKAKAIWMLRHYLAVAKSDVARFGPENGIRNLSRLVAGNISDWRANCNAEVREQVSILIKADLSPVDAAAVFWWARNQLYFDQRLWEDDRVRVLRYESLIEAPSECLRGVSDFLGLSLPSRSMVNAVRQSRRSSGGLHPSVEDLCSGLLARFNGVPELAPS
jgi:Sulfotransferase domain